MSNVNGFRSHVRRLGAAYAVLFVSLALTFTACALLQNNLRHRQSERFKATAQVVFESTENSVGFFLKLMEGVRGLFVQRIPEPEEVRAYFKSIDISDLERHSALEGVGLIWRVTPQNQQQFLDYFHQRKMTNVTVSWGSTPGEHFPIVDLESNYDGTDSVVGWDVGSDKVRGEALRRARETGQPALTPKLRIFSPNGKAVTEGFILYIPIFDGGAIPATGPERERKLLGFIFGSFDAKKFFEGVMHNRESILDVEVFDGPVEFKNLLYDHDGVCQAGAANQPPLRGNIQGDIFGRTWTFHFMEAPGLWSPAERALPMLLLGGGVLMSFCFFGLVCSQAHGRKVAEGLNERLRQSKQELETTLANKAKAEESLTRREKQYRDLVETSDDLIWAVDTEGCWTFVNQQAVRRIYGYEPGEMLGRPFTDFETLHQAARDMTAFQRIKDGEPAFNYITQHLRKDGAPVWLSFNAIVVRDEKGKVLGTTGTARDITAQRKTEQRLQDSELLYQSLVETLPQCIFRKDKEGRFTFANSAFCELLHLELPEVLGRTDLDLYPPELARKYSEDDGRVMDSGTPFEGVDSYKDWEGRLRHMQVVKNPLYDARGELVGIQGIFWDITDKMKMEGELVKSSKLESIGLLAGGIAHDFNNILTAILGNISLLRYTGSLPQEANLRLEDVQKACLRARGLTQQLLTFAKGGAPIKQSASIVEIIRDSSEFALRGSNVRAEYSFASGLPRVEVDASQISQVIQNLVINANQAMPNGGTIEINGIERVIGPESDLPLNPGHYVLISVRDHGTGIPPDLLPKIFDPYFTTKPTGTGLGLATAYSVLRRHDGVITVESKVGEGTVFRIYLPASVRGPIPAAPARASQNLLRGSGRILAMDDEPAIRTLVSVVLRQFGYEVQTVENGTEAIDKYSEALKTDTPYDAVIMDLTIPGGMGGREAIRELLRIDPNVRAIVSSGYSSDPVMSDYRSFGFSGIVAKPYRMEDLGRVVQEVLREGKG